MSLELRALFLDCRTEATSWHMQQRPLSETHRPAQRTHDRLHCNASTGSVAAVLELKIAPRPAVSHTMLLVRSCYNIHTPQLLLHFVSPLSFCLLSPLLLHAAIQRLVIIQFINSNVYFEKPYYFGTHTRIVLRCICIL